MGPPGSELAQQDRHVVGRAQELGGGALRHTRTAGSVRHAHGAPEHEGEHLLREGGGQGRGKAMRVLVAVSRGEWRWRWWSATQQEREEEEEG